MHTIPFFRHPRAKPKVYDFVAGVRDQTAGRKVFAGYGTAHHLLVDVPSRFVTAPIKANGPRPWKRETRIAVWILGEGAKIHLFYW